MEADGKELFLLISRESFDYWLTYVFVHFLNNTKYFLNKTFLF